MDPLLDALWLRVLEEWDEDKPHNALMEYAIAQQRLPEIVGLYGGVKENDAERFVRAQKMLDRIILAATHLSMARNNPPAPQKVPTWLAATAFVLFCLALLFMALGR